MNEKIPKRIIQMGRGFDMPPVAKVSSVNIKLLNPDFEYIFFDDRMIEDFINDQFHDYKDTFNSFKYPIQKFDFFRYLAVYHFGGFYFDLDVLLYKKLSDLIDSGCVFPFERIGINFYLKRNYDMHWDLGNYAFGAAPGHPFIYAIIENCIRAQKEPEWLQQMLKTIPLINRQKYYVICSTGPGLVTRTYAENPDLQSGVKILWTENIFDPNCWNRFGNYGIHLMAGSWLKKKNIVYRILSRFHYGYTEKKIIKLAKIHMQNKINA